MAVLIKRKKKSRFKCKCFRKKQQRKYLSTTCIALTVMYLYMYFKNRTTTTSTTSTVTTLTTTTPTTNQNTPPHPTRDTYYIQPMSYNRAMPAGQAKCRSLSVLRTNLIVCARKLQHFGLFRDHIQRESDVYRMISRSFQKDKHGQRPPKAFVDIGANHGLMSIYAAKNGAATIIAVEPNHYLSRLILKGFQRNNMVASAELFNAACIDATTNETVRLKDHGIAEGAVGTVVRGSLNGGSKGGGSIPAVPVAAFLPSKGGTVGVLKIDVEGHELSVMASLVTALKTKAWNIENVVIEFGPPSRWTKSSSTYTTALAVSIISKLRAQHYEVHVMDSFAYRHFQKSTGKSILDNPTGMKKKLYGVRVDPLTNGDWSIMDAMSACNCEAYLWLYKPANGTQLHTNHQHQSWYSFISLTFRNWNFWLASMGFWWCCSACCFVAVVWGWVKFCPEDNVVEYESVNRRTLSSGGTRSSSGTARKFGIQRV